jgi:hypothetical protein
MTYFSNRFSQKEKPLAAVPGIVLFILIAGFLAQIYWHFYSEGPEIRQETLPDVPKINTLRLFGLDDNLAMSKLLMLWLQAFDNQPGISIPFSELDYDKTIDWLETILVMDPQAQYPLLAASRIYTVVPDEQRQRKMLEFVNEQFLLDPDSRWKWQAHAVYMAKHRLKDFELALRYARTLTKYATGDNIPHWAKQMEIYVLEDMGELESAKVLIGGLIDSGAIIDTNELRFLKQRLQEIEARQSETIP